MILKRIVETLFPKNYSCICCDMDIFNNPYMICDSCKNSLPYLKGRICLHCGDLLVSDGAYCKRCKGKKFIYDRAVATFIYKDKIKYLIHNFKYNNAKYLSQPLSRFMVDTFLNEKLYADVVVPVPLCDKRMKERGYNQSKLLADEISKIINIPVCDALLRVRETPTQTELNFYERQKNLKDAFKAINKKTIKDKSVLLIDDVFTTGATITECSKVLKSSGARVVYVLTLAHTIIGNSD